jgi:hypothetical protein
MALSKTFLFLFLFLLMFLFSAIGLITYQISDTQPSFLYIELAGAMVTNSTQVYHLSTISSNIINNNTLQNVSFVLYKDPTGLYSIPYPSDWKVHDVKRELNQSDEQGSFIQFGNASASLGITISNSTKELNVNTMKVVEKSAEELVKGRIDFLTRLSQNNITGVNTSITSNLAANFKYIRDMPVKVGVNGDLGWKFDYTDHVFNLEQYHSDIYMVKNGKVIAFIYTSDPLKVPETLPIAQKMIDLFQFTTVK